MKSDHKKLAEQTERDQVEENGRRLFHIGHLLVFEDVVILAQTTTLLREPLQGRTEIEAWAAFSGGIVDMAV